MRWTRSSRAPTSYLHPDDAARMGVEHGDFVRVTSRRGTIELEARVSHRETPGSCFIPFHFREAAANVLTIDEIDPTGKIPEFKFCAVKIEPVGGKGDVRGDVRAGRRLMVPDNGGNGDRGDMPSSRSRAQAAARGRPRASRAAPGSSPAPR